MRCGTIRRTLCANKRPNCSRHVAQKAQCARSRCAKAPSRRTGHGGGPRLANVARRGERSAGQRRNSASRGRLANLRSKHTSPDPHPPYTHERAQLGPRSRYVITSWRYMGLWERHGRIVIKQSNAAQRIKQSKSHEYHFPIPLVFEIKTIKIP